MSESETDNIVPRATIMPVPFGRAEPVTDRAFRCTEDGRVYRVRREAVPGTAGIGALRREYLVQVVALAAGVLLEIVLQSGVLDTLVPPALAGKLQIALLAAVILGRLVAQDKPDAR